MKKTIMLVLCCSILLHGCFSYSYLPKEVFKQESLSEENILITLIDGSVIESQYHHHIYTTERSDFIYCSGKWKHRSGAETPFVGKLERSFIDSLKKDEFGLKGSYLCYLSGGTIISFREEDYISVTPDQSPGLWCTGVLTVNSKESIFKGKIPDERIKDIKIKKENILPLIALTVGGIVVIASILSILSGGWGGFGLKGHL
jgi:hypothetical protein